VSSNRLVFSGLEELKAQLRALPEDLADEASVIVQEHAQTAAAAVRAVYASHRDGGDLTEGVVVEINTWGRFGTSVVVRSKAKHAWLFDHGSQARHYITRHGVQHLTGRMPARPTFIPTMMRFRRAMYVALADMLRAHGLIVTGQAEAA
jgi:hypothetical protein